MMERKPITVTVETPEGTTVLTGRGILTGASVKDDAVVSELAEGVTIFEVYGEYTITRTLNVPTEPGTVFKARNKISRGLDYFVTLADGRVAQSRYLRSPLSHEEFNGNWRVVDDE